MLRLLCQKDFTDRGIATGGEWPALDALMMAGKVAHEVFEEEKKMELAGEVERFEREKSLKKPVNGISMIDVSMQEKVASERAFKNPITDTSLDLHANKAKGVVREKSISPATNSYGKFKKELKEEDGLELKNKNKKRGLKRKYVDNEDDYEWGEEFEAKKGSNKTGKKKNTESDNKRSKKSPKKVVPKCPWSPPPMPEDMKAVITHMNGTDMVLVIQKVLRKSDIKDDQNRLLIPFKQIKRENFLTAEEMNSLNRKVDMPTTIVEPSLKIFNEVVFAQWDMNKVSGKTSFNYVLKTDWKHVVKRNDLKVFEIVQLWSFRIQGKLCFALFRNKEEVNSASDSQTTEDNNNGSGSNGSENGASTSQSGVGVQGGSGCIGDGSGANTTSPNGKCSDNSVSSNANCNESIGNINGVGSSQSTKGEYGATRECNASGSGSDQEWRLCAN